MSRDDSLIDKADTLIQRRRVFVAGGVRSLRPAPGEEVPAVRNGDLPVLTDVVVPLSELPPAPQPTIPQEQIDARAMELLQARLPLHRQAVADELLAWLDTELPQVVMRVLDGVTDQIIAQVTEDARAALLPRIRDALEATGSSIDETTAEPVVADVDRSS